MQRSKRAIKWGNVMNELVKGFNQVYFILSEILKDKVIF
ncbi:hypothetical protein J5U22_01569 [Saccharolobus shibatae]|uniref:Uncharacterized protein n=1 Tax=Saccharolobus shibatae TaxID=2286 RepID=A0A8F5BV55_9CREN|nr:hypothetical protein J5U21_01688 [Saccharolobus shibatae]QXJ35022.1 hypothetical protein J5U22_01569 [Saccharolobus shibatae]